MDIATWTAMVVLFFAAGLSPGPAVLLVMSSALRFGVAPAMAAATGVAAANLVWLSLSATGAAAIAAASPTAFAALKVAGFAFMAYLGVSMIVRAARPAHVEAADAPKRASLFVHGVGLQLSSPFALVFFALILPPFFDPERSLPPQALIVAVTITATELVGLGLYAAGAAGLRTLFDNPRFVKTLDMVAGALLIAAGLYVLVAA